MKSKMKMSVYSVMLLMFASQSSWAKPTDSAPARCKDRDAKCVSKSMKDQLRMGIGEINNWKRVIKDMQAANVDATQIDQLGKELEGVWNKFAQLIIDYEKRKEHKKFRKDDALHIAHLYVMLYNEAPTNPTRADQLKGLEQSILSGELTPSPPADAYTGD